MESKDFNFQLWKQENLFKPMNSVKGLMRRTKTSNVSYFKTEEDARMFFMGYSEGLRKGAWTLGWMLVAVLVIIRLVLWML